MHRRLSILIAITTAAMLAPARATAPEALTQPVFEMFRLAPGKSEAFIRSMAEWDKVNVAGGQPPTQLFLHAGGEGWDVLLYKPARPKPTPAQEAAMAAKIAELKLPTGALYFVSVREEMADHVHFEASGPTTAAQWVAELEGQRARRAAER
jgi:hypothetical protein